MSRSGNVWDNAAMESFFSSLKTERTARKVYRSRDDRNVSTEAAIAFLKRHLAP
jgi:transposase InsO family protein